MEDLTVKQLRQVAVQSRNAKNYAQKVLAECLLNAVNQIERLQLQHREATMLIGKLSSELSLADRPKGITLAKRVDL